MTHLCMLDILFLNFILFSKIPIGDYTHVCCFSFAVKIATLDKYLLLHNMADIILVPQI